MIVYKSERELTYMRDAGRIVAGTLREVKQAAKPEVTTLELDRVAADYIKRWEQNHRLKVIMALKAIFARQ